jgi:ketosteroid isomerase-like protein
VTTAAEMNDLIDRHIKAEIAGDSSLAASVYTDDVVHDVVGWPTGPVTGPAAAREFYEQLMAAFDNERMDVAWCRHGDDFCVVEHETTVPFQGCSWACPATADERPSACSTCSRSAMDASAAKMSGSTAARSSPSSTPDASTDRAAGRHEPAVPDKGGPPRRRDYQAVHMGRCPVAVTGSVAGRPRMPVSTTEQQEAVDRFLAAIRHGDLQGLLDVLAPDVVVVSARLAQRVTGRPDRHRR